MKKNPKLQFPRMSSEAFELMTAGFAHSDKQDYIKIHSSRSQLGQQGSTLKLLQKNHQALKKITKMN